MGKARAACTSLAVWLALSLCFWCPGAAAAVYTWVGGLSGSWSDASRWDPNTGCPAGRDDVGVINTANQMATYDAASSGVVGGIQVYGRVDNQRVIVDRDLLADYTGDTGSSLTPAGWVYLQIDDSSSCGFTVNAGRTMTITGYKGYGDAHCWGGNRGPGTLRFARDGGGYGYFYAGGTTGQNFENMSVDFSDLAFIESMDNTGAGRIARGFATTNADNMTLANSRSIIVGRADGTDQVFTAKAAVAGQRSGVGFTLVPGGMDGRYGPHLLVNASGTPASPNRIVLKREGLGGLAFPDNTSRADGGSWIQASGPGVARLVVEGNFTTADNSATDALWDMSRIQLQMSGQAPSDAPQALRWCGQDTNAGGTGDLMDLSGFANNYAVRNLILGGDDGATDNYVNFTTVGTSGRSAMYVWGLEFAADAYLNIGAGDYLYYLGTGSSAGGINGMGLTLPTGKSLTDLTNLPDHVIMLGVPEPASAALLLAGGALACHHCRRRPKKNRGK